MIDNFHVQCYMVRDNEHYTAWIPEKFAVFGNMIDIKIDDKWEKGWMVVEGYTKLPSDKVIERSQDYKKTRKGSDI